MGLARTVISASGTLGTRENSAISGFSTLGNREDSVISAFSTLGTQYFQMTRTRVSMTESCSLCQTIWTTGLPTRDSSSITGLVLDKLFPLSLYYHGVVLNRPRDRQHGDINPDPLATAQLQHAIIRKPYGLVPFFGYSTPKACLGVRRTSLTTKPKSRRNRMRSQRNSILRRKFTFQRPSQPQFTEFLQQEIRRRRMNLTKRLPRAFFGIET